MVQGSDLQLGLWSRSKESQGIRQAGWLGCGKWRSVVEVRPTAWGYWILARISRNWHRGSVTWSHQAYRIRSGGSFHLSTHGMDWAILRPNGGAHRWESGRLERHSGSRGSPERGEKRDCNLPSALWLFQLRFLRDAQMSGFLVLPATLQIPPTKNNYLASLKTAHTVNVYDINRGAENYIYLYLSQGNKTFPEMDEFTLKTFEAEGRTARQRMLNLKFDSWW